MGKPVPAGKLVQHIGRGASLVRRHLAQLELKGVLTRRVTIGGSGGTRSMVGFSPELESGVKAQIP